MAEETGVPSGAADAATPPQKALTQPEFEGLAADAIINDEKGIPINPRPTTFEEGKFFAPPGGDEGADADAATPPPKALTQPEFEGLAADAIINDEKGIPINPRPTTFEEGKFFAPPGGDGGGGGGGGANAVEGDNPQPTNEEQQKLFGSVMGKSIELMVRDGEMTKEFALKLPNLTDEQKKIISEIVVQTKKAVAVDGQGEVDPNTAKNQLGGRRRTKRKDRKCSRKSRKGAKKGAKKSRKGAKQSKKGGRRRSSKNRRKHSRRLKH